MKLGSVILLKFSAIQKGISSKINPVIFFKVTAFQTVSYFGSSGIGYKCNCLSNHIIPIYR